MNCAVLKENCAAKKKKLTKKILIITSALRLSSKDCGQDFITPSSITPRLCMSKVTSL